LELPLVVIRGVEDQLLVSPLPLLAVLLVLGVLELELPLVVIQNLKDRPQVILK
jgi:hypothetical protein